MRGKGDSLDRSFILFCLALWATGRGDRDRAREGGDSRARRRERKEAPWVDAARYPAWPQPNVTVERGAICPLTSA